MQEKLQDSYIRVANKARATPILVGDAVIYVADTHKLDMWHLDGRHPSETTTALAACMIHNTIKPGVACPLGPGLIVDTANNITI